MNSQINITDDDFTVCMAVGKYPFAEIAVSSIQYFYPNINIIIRFGLNDQHSKLREKFFLDRNVQIIGNLFKKQWRGSVDHAYNLDEIIRHVKTKYFIVFDDDIVMYRKNLLEYLKEIFRLYDIYAHIDNVSKSHLVILPYCFSMNIDIYRKYNMTFKPYLTDGFDFDTGLLILIDCFKYNLKIKKDYENSIYVQHLWNSSDKFWDAKEQVLRPFAKIKKEIMELCDGKTIPLLTRNLFNKPEITFDKKYYNASVIGKDIIEGNIPNFLVIPNYNKKSVIDTKQTKVEKQVKQNKQFKKIPI